LKTSEPIANADNSLAMELKTDLQNRAARDFALWEKGPRGATDGRLTDSSNFGSMPSAQTAMGARATPNAFGARHRQKEGCVIRDRRIYSDYPLKQWLMRRGAAAFSYRV
jgi:hypothetical protein